MIASHRTVRLVPSIGSALVAAFAGLVISGCAGQGVPKDPIATLSQPRNSAKSHMSALAQLDGPVPSDSYLRTLKTIALSNQYLIPIRKAAYQRLARYDEVALVDALSTTLGRLEPPEYRAWVIDEVAAADLEELTKAIIRSWAIPVRLWAREDERPEPEALARMYGADKVPTVLIRTLLDARPLIEANLRARCWELVVTAGHEERLVTLVSDDELVRNDGLLLDMRAAIEDFNMVPRNREEILWIRELRKPEHRTYWESLSKALPTLEESRRRRLEPRDLAVVDAVFRHRPELLRLDDDALFTMLSDGLKEDGGRYTADVTGWSVRVSEGIHDDRDVLTWGDLAAMLLARSALEEPALREHVFDFAERDLLDRTTEFGGVIRIDAEGRFELVEHPPRTRVADNRYLASQALFDDGYTALFHFHNHAQTYRNSRYAGPHVGDMEYADETGANGLVFTFIDPTTINVDFYRHGAVIVDLGTIRRPATG